MSCLPWKCKNNKHFKVQITHVFEFYRNLVGSHLPRFTFEWRPYPTVLSADYKLIESPCKEKYILIHTWSDPRLRRKYIRGLLEDYILTMMRIIWGNWRWFIRYILSTGLPARRNIFLWWGRLFWFDFTGISGLRQNWVRIHSIWCAATTWQRCCETVCDTEFMIFTVIGDGILEFRDHSDYFPQSQKWGKFINVFFTTKGLFPRASLLLRYFTTNVRRTTPAKTDSTRKEPTTANAATLTSCCSGSLFFTPQPA